MDPKDSIKQTKNLFSEFPPISTEEWEKKIETDLKGADYNKKLVWHTLEGMEVRPYYRSENLEGLKYQDIFPSEFPFVRGNKKSKNDWFIRQDIKVDKIAEANKKALEILMRGVNSLGFIFAEKKISADDFNKLLENIWVKSIELNLIGKGQELHLLELLLDVLKGRNREMSEIKGSIDFDPLGCASISGKLSGSEDALFETAAQLIKKSSNLAGLRTLSVSGTLFNNAGADICQELACSLSAGVEYLTQLNKRGISVTDIAPKIQFNFAIGGNYFMEIAKFRAARLLWANIVKAYGPASEEVCQMHIHASNSEWNKTLYDPYVNMLRTTTEAMSGALAGVDSMTVLPFNSVFEETTSFSERIARNQQLLLKEESHLDKVVDPGAGSYYIESLTDQIAEKTWEIFLAIEEKGGFLSALKEGFIQQIIKETALTRDKNIATRKDVILGTNQYPNTTEWIGKEISEQTISPADYTVEDAEFESLKPYRGAIAFEKLRLDTERFAAKNHRPKAFMLTMGNLAMRRARAQFSINFFGCAGFELIDNIGFKDVDSALAAAKNQKADILVVCSSDEDYAEIMPEILQKASQDYLIVLAGYPKELLEQLKEQGLKHCIHVRSNVLETLKAFQKELHIIE